MPNALIIRVESEDDLPMGAAERVATALEDHGFEVRTWVRDERAAILSVDEP